MCNYWLYILKHEPHVEGCALAVSISPTERDVRDGNLQITTFKSVTDLLEMLGKVGISSEMLQQAKAGLDSDGWETLREIPLSGEQLNMLGFKTP
jgi:hypothetical protein